MAEVIAAGLPQIGQARDPSGKEEFLFHGQMGIGFFKNPRCGGVQEFETINNRIES